MPRVRADGGGGVVASGAQQGARVRELLVGPLEAAGYDLEDVSVTRAGARSVVRVVVDRDEGVDLDAVADASRVIGDLLDADDDLLPGAYALEVTSPGVDRPLRAVRHWRRNLGRLVRVSRTDGTEVTGRVVEAGELSATLELETGRVDVRYAEVARAVVQIEFRRAGAAGDQAGELTDGADDDGSADSSADSEEA